MSVCINHISVYLPESTLSNADLALKFGVDEDQVLKNTRIERRFISSPFEISSDMAIKAGNNLFQ